MITSCVKNIADWEASGYLHGNGLFQVVAFYDLFLLVMVDDVINTVDRCGTLKMESKVKIP